MEAFEQQIRFDKRVGIVTGAGRGLGRIYALWLAARGAQVVVNDIGTAGEASERHKASAAVVAEEITRLGGVAIPNFDNAAEKEGAQRLVQATVNHFGRVDIVVNNAGVLRDKTLVNMTVEDFELVVRVHLLGPAYITKAALPIMQQNKYGRIVVTTSIAGLYGSFGQTNYSAAKMGTIGFMNALKLEVEKHNILVNCISPLAATPLAKETGVFPEEAIHAFEPELVAPVVTYLCSDQCHHSGLIITAGGGYFCRSRIVENSGVRFPVEKNITPELIADQFLKIIDMSETVVYEGAMQKFKTMVSPFISKEPSDQSSGH